MSHLVVENIRHTNYRVISSSNMLSLDLDNDILTFDTIIT